MPDNPEKFSFRRRLVPSVAALIAFESAARWGSFTRAAEELGLTQGAISRQIKLLEDQLGVVLFERVRQRIVLTEAGSYFSSEIRQTLSRFAAVTAQVISFRAAGGILRLGILPTFGTKWLIPRLPKFFAEHRDVTINFSSHIRPVDFHRNLLDAAIHFGPSDWPGVVMHRLIGEELVPVASPKLVKRNKIKKAEDLAKETLLVQATRPEAWINWFRSVGLDPVEPSSLLVFEQFAMVLQAAVAELGVALVPKILVKDEIDSGDLVQLFDRSIIDDKGYFLAYPREREKYPPLVAFRDWLLGQIKG